MADAAKPWTMRLADRINRPHTNTLVASGEEVDLGNATAINEVLARRQDWQRQAIDAYDACPEVYYGVEFLAALMSRITFFAAEIPDTKDGEPILTKNKDVIATLERLGAPVERAELQRAAARQLLLPGEGYLINIQPGEGRLNTEERWEIRSVFEVEPADTTAQVRSSPTDSNPIVLKKGKDTWIRLWHSHPRYHGLATSHVRPILDAVDELLWWDSAARAFARNRLANAGAVGIPQNLEVPAESDEEAMMSGADRFAKKFFNAAIEAIQNPGSAAAAVPIFYTYPPNDHGVSGLDYLRMDRPQDALLELRVQRCLQRIQQGLNIPVEVITGLGSATHRGQGQVTESAFREHAEPLAILLCNAFTIAYLRPIIRKLQIKNPEKYLIWYDASQLIAQPDMTQAADRGAELLMIGPPAWRRVRGFSEEDAPTAAEEERMLKILQETRGRIPPGGGAEVNPTAPDQPASERKTPTADGPPGDHPPTDTPAVTRRGKGQDAVTASLTNGHVHPAIPILIARLQVLGDEKIRRALERAGNKLRRRADKVSSYKATLRNVPPESVAATLGREAVTQLGIDDLFDGSFDTAAAQFSLYCNGLVPSLQTATIGREFSNALRVIAAENLFAPPTFDSLVPLELVVTFLSRLGIENLSTEALGV